MTDDATTATGGRLEMWPATRPLATSRGGRPVLTLMAQGLTTVGLSTELQLSVNTVEAHIRSIFAKLGLRLDEREHRRVLAVLAFLRA